MSDIFSDRYKFRRAIILEPLTDIDRRSAIAFVKLGFEVDILPRCDNPEDFRLDTGESLNVYGVYKPLEEK